MESSSTRNLLEYTLLTLLVLTFSRLLKAEASNNTTGIPPPSHLPNHIPTVHGQHTITAVALSSLAAAISSAGGVGGGPLFLPILKLVAGLDMKTSATFSSFMVTGVFLSNSIYYLSNSIYYLFFPGIINRKPLIDYGIALLSQPFMLLGVSLGVICNIMFPEWFITVLFALFLAYSTYNTCKAGLRHWSNESEAQRRIGNGTEGSSGLDRPLLDEGIATAIGTRMLWKDIVVLVLVWVFFFLLHLLTGDKHGKGIISVKPCGSVYWLITFSQVPFAIVITIYIVCDKRNTRVKIYQEIDYKEIPAKDRFQASSMLVFPFAALLTGTLGGLFGVGGGLLLNPLLLQIGVPPQIAVATSSFILLFSATMTMIQYIILGMRNIEQASVYAVFCFVASAVGLVIIQGTVSRSGRVSLTIFAVTLVMALSAVVITISGAFDVWAQYTSGEYMGFKLPC